LGRWANCRNKRGGTVYGKRKVTKATRPPKNQKTQATAPNKKLRGSQMGSLSAH